MSTSNKLKKRRVSDAPPLDDSAAGASSPTTDSNPTGDKFTWVDVLQNTSTFLEILKNVGDVTQALGPLKAICGVLKIATDTAKLLVSNGEDLQDLLDKLNPQQRFLESEIEKLSKPEYSKSDNVRDLIEPLWTYVWDLKTLHDKLDTLKARYDDKSKRKRIKTVLMAQSDQDHILNLLKKMENSFRHFMHSATSFIARQTLLIRDEIAQLHDSMAEMTAETRRHMEEKDALNKLTYIGARGHQHDTCAEGTRVDLLEDIGRWANDKTAKPIFAIVDRAGTGKSTIAATMTQEWEKDGLLLTRFFFSKPTVVSGKDLAGTLARDIAENMPSLSPLIIDAVKQHPNFAVCSIREQIEWLVFIPLKSMKTLRIMVIDALDECPKQDRDTLLKSLLNYITTFPTGTCPLKVLLTCRPEEDLSSRIHGSQYANLIHQSSVSLYSNQFPSNEADIRLYATRFLGNYLSAYQLNQFVKRAAGLFIWAATVHKFLVDAYDPSARFDTIIQSRSSEPPLSALYNEILDSSLKRAGADGQEILKKILGVICVAREPLVVEAMDELLELRPGVACRVIMSLQSVLSGGNDHQTVQILHPTFMEYLQDLQPGHVLAIGTGAESMVSKGCLNTLLAGLNCKASGIIRCVPTKNEGHQAKDEDLVEQIREKERKFIQNRREKMTDGLRYAVIHGLSHVAFSLHDQKVVEGLRKFFMNNLLDWIELMSVLGRIGLLMQLVYYLKVRIEELIDMGGSLTTKDRDWCQDTLNMVQPSQMAIEESQLQIYFSALPFTSEASNISRFYLPHFIEKIPKVLQSKAPKVLRSEEHEESSKLVLVGHEKAINYLVYSPSGRYLASASKDNTLRIWDTTTGGLINIFTKHTGCPAFSPDGKYIASLFSGILCIWDVTTREKVNEFDCRISRYPCLTFLSDGRHIAFVSSISNGQDEVKIYNILTKQAFHKLRSDSGSIRCLVFSPDGKHLASGHENHIVRIWSILETEPTGYKLGGSAICVAFSPDGKHLASGNDSNIYISDVVTGAIVAAFSASVNEDARLAFTPNGHLTLVYMNGTSYFWDKATKKPTLTRIGDIRSTLCAALSPDGHSLALGVGNRIQLWNDAIGTVTKVTTENRVKKEIIVFSHNGTYLATLFDGVVRIWDARLMTTLHTFSIPTITLSLAISSDRRHLATEIFGEVHIWDITTGTRIRTIVFLWTTCLAFSPDGRYLITGNAEGAVYFWDIETGVAMRNPLYHSGPILSAKFQPPKEAQLLVVEHAMEMTFSGGISTKTVWEISIDTLGAVTTDQQPVESPQMEVTRSWIYVPKIGITFNLPSNFEYRTYCLSEGKLTYLMDDGSITVIDYNHLI